MKIENLEVAQRRIRALKESLNRLNQLKKSECLGIAAKCNKTHFWEEDVIVDQETAEKFVSDTIKAYEEELAKLENIINLAEAALRGMA